MNKTFFEMQKKYEELNEQIIPPNPSRDLNDNRRGK